MYMYIVIWDTFRLLLYNFGTKITVQLKIVSKSPQTLCLYCCRDGLNFQSCSTQMKAGKVAIRLISL